MKRKNIDRSRSKFISNTFLIIFLGIILNGCKSPESPEESIPPVPQYRNSVKVIYTRNVSADYYTGYQGGVTIRYSLVDPSGYLDEGEERGLISDRYYCGEMERIGKNKFRIILKHVLIQDEYNQSKHSITIWDNAVPFGTTIDEENIDIEGAYDLEFEAGGASGLPSTMIEFKISVE